MLWIDAMLEVLFSYKNFVMIHLTKIRGFQLKELPTSACKNWLLKSHEVSLSDILNIPGTYVIQKTIGVRNF